MKFAFRAALSLCLLLNGIPAFAQQYSGSGPSQQPGAYWLLVNAAASGPVIRPQGGNYVFHISGTFNGATVTLTENFGANSQTLGTYTSAPSSDPCFAIPQGATVQATISGSPSAMYASIGGVGSCASSGSGGGAITAASGAFAAGALSVGAGTDGWDATQGAKADSACGSDAGTCSLLALIKRALGTLTTLNTTASSAVAAGINRIGYVSDDPCAQGTKSTAHFSSTSSGGNLITGTTAKITYICGYSIVTSAAAHVSLCEATSTACSGGTPAAVFGNTGTTAANGKSYAANGGETFGNGGYTIAKTATTGQNVDVLFDTTNSPQVNVDVAYVQQ